MRLQTLVIHILASLIMQVSVHGQNQTLEGIWKGVIPTTANDIELYWRINIVRSDSLLVLHDCPVYGVKDVPAPASRISGDSVLLKVERFPATFYGLRGTDPDKIDGFYQAEGGALPFTIQRISQDPALLLPYMAPRINSMGQKITSWEYRIPIDRDDDWQTGDAEKAGFHR